MENILKFTLIFLVVITSSCSNFEPELVISQEVPDIEQLSNFKIYDLVNGKRVEVTTTYLKEKWETELNQEGVDVDLNTFEIVQSQSDNGEEFHFLKAKSTDGTFQTGAFLVIQVSKGIDPVGFLGSKSCSCKGCPNGCNLTISGSNCYCSSCPDKDGKCEKTESGNTN